MKITHQRACYAVEFQMTATVEMQLGRTQAETTQRPGLSTAASGGIIPKAGSLAGLHRNVDRALRTKSSQVIGAAVRSARLARNWYEIQRSAAKVERRNARATQTSPSLVPA